jgi:hypothetical protein
MCLAPIPPHEYSSKNAFDTLVGEEERVENEKQHHIQEGFFQLIEDVGLPSNLNFEMISYGVDNALESFISYIKTLNRASQFDEINPQFFKNNAYDTVSSHLHQEL